MVVERQGGSQTCQHKMVSLASTWRCRQEGQKVEVIRSYLVSSRVAWTTWDPALMGGVCIHCLQRLGEGIRYSRIVVIDACELPCRCQRLNLSSPEKQHTLLTNKLSLQLPRLFVFLSWKSTSFSSSFQYLFDVGIFFFQLLVTF